jgi:hypothetical protein
MLNLQTVISHNMNFFEINYRSIDSENNKKLMNVFNRLFNEIIHKQRKLLCHSVE